MAHVAHVPYPHVGRTGTAAIVAAVIGAGAAVGAVALAGGFGSDDATTPAQALPSGAAYVLPAAHTAPLSPQATAARYHTPR